DPDDPRPAVDPKLLRLPPGIEDTGDPVDQNPFRPTDSRHDLWARATREAVEKRSRLKAEWLAFVREHSSVPRVHLNEMLEASRDLSARKRNVLGQEFEIWAARGMQVVMLDEEVKKFDAWLVGYAGAILEFEARHMSEAGLPQHLIEAETRRSQQRI